MSRGGERSSGEAPPCLQEAAARRGGGMWRSGSPGTQLKKAASTAPAEQREEHRRGREQRTATKCLGKARWEASSTTQTKPIKGFFLRRSQESPSCLGGRREMREMLVGLLGFFPGGLGGEQPPSRAPPSRPGSALRARWDGPTRAGSRWELRDRFWGQGRATRERMPAGRSPRGRGAF